MAVSKLWAVSKNLNQVLDYATNPEKTSTQSVDDFQALKDVLDYAQNGEKTERKYFCEGINCNVETALDQFISIKEQFDKTEGVQAYHGYISFKEMDITPEFAQMVGIEFVKRVWGQRFQCVVTTHLNTNHLHCHFVINSVSFVDGKKLQNEEKAWFKFRLVADELCREYGLHGIDRPERNPASKFLTLQDNAGLPTRYNQTRWAIDQAISQSKTKEQFRKILKEMGYALNYNPKHKYWTIIPKGDKKPIRLYRLGPEYEQQRIMERIKESKGKIELNQFHEVKQKANSSPVYKKADGLYNLYLYYCYMLGYLSKHRKQKTYRLHYLLRDDLIKLDELTDQVTLLGQQNIQTEKELLDYLYLVERQIDGLVKERTRLRNKLRTVNISELEQRKTKKTITEISQKLKELRKELKLCHGIAKRSGVIRANVEQIISEEEKTQRKERGPYEHQR